MEAAMEEGGNKALFWCILGLTDEGSRRTFGQATAPAKGLKLRSARRQEKRDDYRSERQATWRADPVHRKQVRAGSVLRQDQAQQDPLLRGFPLLQEDGRFDHRPGVHAS